MPGLENRRLAHRGRGVTLIAMLVAAFACGAGAQAWHPARASALIAVNDCDDGTSDCDTGGDGGGAQASGADQSTDDPSEPASDPNDQSGATPGLGDPGEPVDPFDPSWDDPDTHIFEPPAGSLPPGSPCQAESIAYHSIPRRGW